MTELSNKEMNRTLPTLLYFFSAAQHFAGEVRKVPDLNRVVEEIYVCGSVGRFSPTPRDIDILVFGKNISEEHRKQLFQLRIEEDESLRAELLRTFPSLQEAVVQSYIDLEINNLKKREYIERNDPMSMKKL